MDKGALTVCVVAAPLISSNAFTLVEIAPGISLHRVPRLGESDRLRLGEESDVYQLRLRSPDYSKKEGMSGVPACAAPIPINRRKTDPRN